MHKYTLASWIVAISLALWPVWATSKAPNLPAQAKPTQPLNWLAQTQAATCANCHTTAPPNETTSTAIPFLGKLNAQDIQKAMLEFKYNKRPATVMHQLAKGYSDTDIERISHVLGQPK